MTDQLYRPGSGTEGLIFENRFCHRCIKDKSVRKDPPDYENGCPILAAMYFLHTDEEGYPTEVVRAPEGDPHWGICTAFEQDPDEEPWDGGRPPFPLPGEIMGAYLETRLSDEPKGRRARELAAWLSSPSQGDDA